MPRILFSNAASTLVTAGGNTAPVSGTVETWTVLSSTSFPAVSNSTSPATAFFIADPALPGEVIEVTNITGVTWAVIRGAEGSTPVAHGTGFTVEEVISAGTLTGMPVTDWLNVKTVFGAAINGSTNDATAWQNAINAVQGTSYGLYFPAGTSIIGSPLSMTAPVAIMGAGRDASVLQLANGVNDYAIKFTQGTGIAITGARFSDFQINGNAINQTATSGGINGIGAVECNFERLHFTNCRDWGLALQAIPGGAFGHHNKIYACTFDNAANIGFGGGGWATSSDENLWLSCDFQYLGGATAPVGTYPVMLLDQAGLQHIENCVFVGSRGSNTNVLGVRIHNAGQTKVVGCTFDGVGGDGVFTNNNDNIITNNTFTSIADQAATAGVFAGVHLEFGTARNLVSNNNLSSSSTANKTGYLIREESTGNAGPNLITGNTLHTQGAVAVALISSAGIGSKVVDNLGWPDNDSLTFAPLPSGDTTGATDTAALQAAINGLPNGGTLVLAAGSSTAPYWINAPLVYKNGQSIKGDGHAKSANAAIVKQAANANMVAPGTPALNGRGIWVSGTAYAINDAVRIPITPNFGFYTSANDRGNFAASTAYAVNDVVYNSGADKLVYINILAYTSTATTPDADSTHWQLVSTALYRCTTALTSTTTPDADAGHWAVVGATGLFVPYEWLNNQNFDGFASLIENVQLDGNRTGNPYSTVSGIITQNFWTDIRRCAIANMPGNGILQTDTTTNGTQITNTSSENRVLENKIYNITLDGFRISNAGVTANLDGFCEDNNVSNCLTGINMDRGAGWQVRGNHLYGIGGNGINVAAAFATKVIDNYVEQFGAQNVPSFFYNGISVNQLNGRGSHISRNFVGSTDPNVNTSTYQLLSVSAGSAQTAQAQCIDNIVAGPASPANSRGLVYQAFGGGTLNVISTNNQITSVATKQYIQASGVNVTSALVDWYNVVSEFGADPAGFGDSTSAIQAAITAAGNAGGGIVYLPAGTYKVTPVSATVPALTVPSNVIIMGAGMGATTILKNGNGILIDFSGLGPISKTSSWNINQGLERLSINGNSKTGLVLRLYYVQMYYERDVKIYSNNDISVDAVQLFDSRVYNGVYLYGGSTTTSTVTGAQAPFHLIRNSASAATTLSAAVSGTITSLPVVALPAAIQAGIVQVWSAGGVVQNFTTTGAASGATSIPVTSTLVTITTAIGNTVNGFGWSGGNTNELKMFGCHWEDNLSGAIWITQGINNTSNVNNIDLIGSKCEQDTIGYNCPQIQVDASANGIRVSGLYFYMGGFNTGFSTAVTGIYFHPGFGSLNNVDMLNATGVSTTSSGIDINQTSLSLSIVNLNQYWNTSPTVAGVSVGTGGVCFLNNIQIGGTVTTKIGGSGANYSVINDPTSSVAIANTLTSGAITAFGSVDVVSVGQGFKVAEGTNAKQGTAVLVGGTKVVTNTAVTANSRIFLTTQVPGGTVGAPYVSARTAGTSFTITSTSGTDTSTVAYEIIEPG